MRGASLVAADDNSYIYGPGGLPVEQINNSTSTVLYLHHDQQGSTRLLTGSTGKPEATFTYDAYGNFTGHTGTATTPLGYDGQYTEGLAQQEEPFLRQSEYLPRVFGSAESAVAGVWHGRSGWWFYYDWNEGFRSMRAQWCACCAYYEGC
jgi:hypothetical protein